MQGISDEMIHEVRTMSDDIGNLSAVLQNLEQRLVDFQELARREEASLVEESEFSHARLGDFEKRLPACIERLKDLQTSFSEKAAFMVSRVQFPKTIVEASPQSMSMFRELTEWAESQEQNGEGAEPNLQHVDILRQGYTMQSERETHDAALRQTAGVLMGKGEAEAEIDLFEACPSTPPKETKSPSAEPSPDSFADFELFDTTPSPSPSTVSELKIEGGPAGSEKDPQTKNNDDLGDNVELF